MNNGQVKMASSTSFVSRDDLDKRIESTPEEMATISKGLSIGGDGEQMDKYLNEMSNKPFGERDTRHFLNMFPDMETAAEIMIATVLSPKDFATIDISYTLEHPQIPHSTLVTLTRMIQESAESSENIKRVMQTALREQLVGKGSLVKVVIPEGVIDKLIFHNEISTESIISRISDDVYGGNSILGKGLDNFQDDHSESFSVESLSFGEERVDREVSLVTITDNYNLLKLPGIIEDRNTSDTNSDLHPHLNTIETATEEKVLMLNNAYRDRKDVSKGLIFDVHPSACKPIPTPGDPSKHAAYIILIGKDGYPITDVPDQPTKAELDKKMKNSGLVTNTISRIASKGLMNQTGDTKKQMNSDIYRNYVSKDLFTRMNNGKFNIDPDTDISAITYTAMARALENKETKLLVLPPSMVQYFANTYDVNGIGVNKIHNLRTLASLRGLLLFSAFNNTVKNNSQTVRVKVEMDPETSDPDKLMKQVKRWVMKMNEGELPVGLSNPADFVKWQQRMGVSFQFDGHPGLSKTRINFEHDERNRSTETNSTMQDEIRRLLLLGIGPSPDMVDNGFDANHAVTSESNKILLGKKSQQLKEPLLDHVSAFVSKIALADGNLFNGLVKTLTEDDNVKKVFSDLDKGDSLSFDYFIHNLAIEAIDMIRVNLPEISSMGKMEENLNELRAYQDWLEVALPSWISEDMMDPTIVGNAGEQARPLIEIYKAYFTRDFINKNHSFSDLNAVISQDNMGQPLLDIFTEVTGHSKSMSENAAELLKSFSKTRKEVDDDLAAAENDLNKPDEPEVEDPEVEDPEREEDIGDTII